MTNLQIESCIQLYRISKNVDVLLTVQPPCRRICKSGANQNAVTLNSSLGKHDNTLNCFSIVMLCYYMPFSPRVIHQETALLGLVCMHYLCICAEFEVPPATVHSTCGHKNALRAEAGIKCVL